MNNTKATTQLLHKVKDSHCNDNCCTKAKQYHHLSIMATFRIAYHTPDTVINGFYKYRLLHYRWVRSGWKWYGSWIDLFSTGNCTRFSTNVVTKHRIQYLVCVFCFIDFLSVCKNCLEPSGLLRVIVCIIYNLRKAVFDKRLVILNENNVSSLSSTFAFKFLKHSPNISTKCWNFSYYLNQTRNQEDVLQLYNRFRNSSSWENNLWTSQ